MDTRIVNSSVRCNSIYLLRSKKCSDLDLVHMIKRVVTRKSKEKINTISQPVWNVFQISVDIKWQVLFCLIQGQGNTAAKNLVSHKEMRLKNRRNVLRPIPMQYFWEMYRMWYWKLLNKNLNVVSSGMCWQSPRPSRLVIQLDAVQDSV